MTGVPVVPGRWPPAECDDGLPVMRFSLAQELREFPAPAQRIQPGIALHRRKAHKAARHDALKQIQRRGTLVQVRKVSRQVEQALRVAEVR